MAQNERRLSSSIEGFQLSKNEAVKYLERGLGIQFPQVPLRVELNFRNRVQRAKDGGIGKMIAGMVKSGAVAEYDRKFGAVFVPKDDLFAELHENGHALLDSINPQIRDAVDQLPVMVEQRVKGYPIDTGDTEKIISLRCFDEGIAQWAALTTVRSMIEDFDSEDVATMEGTIAQGVEGHFGRIRQAVSAYKTALSQTGPKVMIEGLKVESQLSDPQYVVGYHFVDGAMQTLNNSGRKIGEALIGLIRKPPERIDDLEKPQEYVVRVKP